MTHWLYPTNEAGPYHLVDPETGEEIAVSAEGVLRWLDARSDEPDEWYLSQGYRSMQAADLLWLYAAGRQELYAVGRVDGVRWDEADEAWYAEVMWLDHETRELMTTPIPRSQFLQIAQAPVRANSTASAVLDEWLRSQDAPGAEEAGRHAASPERVLTEVVHRREQFAFRRRLLAAYEGRCAVTGESVEAVLEAAHITPYSKEALNDLSNGLLLRADLHNLFDLCLIAVDPAGRLEVSSTLSATSYAALAGRLLALPASPDARPSRERLARHREGLLAGSVNRDASGPRTSAGPRFGSTRVS